MAKEDKKTTAPIEETTTIAVEATPVEEPIVAEETVVEETTVEPTETVETLREFVADKYGETFDDDAGLLAFVKTKLDNAVAGDSVIGEILAEYPELYAVIQDLDAGKPFEVALAANIDVEDLKPLEGDEDYAAYAEAKDARKARRAKADEHKKRFESNRDESIKIVEAYFAEKTMDEKAGEDFANYIDTMIADYLDGKVTRDFLDVFYRGMHYGEDVEKAREAGAIDAKNARIDAEREKRSQQTDGMPSPGSAIATPTTTVEEDDFFSELGRNSRKKW